MASGVELEKGPEIGMDGGLLAAPVRQWLRASLQECGGIGEWPDSGCGWMGGEEENEIGTLESLLLPLYTCIWCPHVRDIKRV